jgi:hypothetical protein
MSNRTDAEPDVLVKTNYKSSTTIAESMIPVVIAVAVNVLLTNSRRDFRYYYCKFAV